MSDEVEAIRVLREAKNATITFSPGIFGKGWVFFQVGKRQVFRIAKMHKDEVARLHNDQLQHPTYVHRVERRTYWQFQDRFYYTDEPLDAAAVYALIVTKQRRQQQQIERAQQIVALDHEPRDASVRRGIPEDVKHLVWTRDQGRCRNCGSNVELQFDHIIPLALGGSDDSQNLQILCGPCNRRKSASITLR